MATYFLGLDLGGTSVKAGVTDQHGKLLSQADEPTGPEKADAVVAAMVQAGRAAIAGAGLTPRQIAAVGVLSPGQASLEKGIVYRAANFPKWKKVPLRAKVTAGLGIRGVLENDANAAAYGEYWAGAGKDQKLETLVMFTLGTGVGGGFVLGGHVIRGSHDFAAEVGHMIIVPGGRRCGCGQRGCMEAYCSAKYTGQRAKALLKESSARSSLRQVLAEKKKITSADVVAHAKAGDALARQVWNETCKYLAISLINTIHHLDPDMVVLAGGMSKAGAFLLDTVQRHFKKQWWKMTPPTATIALARLGNDAGVIGAAGVARDAFLRKALPAIGR